GVGGRHHAHPQGTRAPRPALYRRAQAPAHFSGRQAGQCRLLCEHHEGGSGAPARGGPAALPGGPARIRQRVLRGQEMRAHAHGPGDQRREHDTALERRLRDRPHHHHGSGEEMSRALALLVLALAAAAAHPEELGRLFCTPEQRAALDARRSARLPDNPVSAARPVTRVDGFVKRSAGPSTVWINGEWTTESSPEAPRIVEPAPAVSVNAGETGG